MSYTDMHVNMSCQPYRAVGWAAVLLKPACPGLPGTVLPAVTLVSAAQTAPSVKYTLQYGVQKSDIFMQHCALFVTPSFIQPEGGLTWQRQCGFADCQLCSLRNHQAVCQSGFYFSPYTSFLLILQSFELFSYYFLKTLDWFYLVIAQEKCNNLIPGAHSAMHGGEKRVQTATGMQKAL